MRQGAFCRGREGIPLPYGDAATLGILHSSFIKKPPLCKGRWQPKADGGIVKHRDQEKTIPQSLSRQLPLHKGAEVLRSSEKITEGYSPLSEREVARQSCDGRSLRQYRHTECRHRSNGHAVSLSHLTVTAPSRKEPTAAPYEDAASSRILYDSFFHVSFILQVPPF